MQIHGKKRKRNRSALFLVLCVILALIREVRALACDALGDVNVELGWVVDVSLTFKTISNPLFKWRTDT